MYSKTLQILAATIILLSCTLSAVAGSSVSRDWSLVGQQALNSSRPLLIIVESPYCEHCQRMELEYLAQPEVKAFLKREAVVSHYDLDTGGKVRDFDGSRLRAKLFLSRYGVFATPTLLFVDGQGEPLAPMIAGYNDAADYGTLVKERLDQARTQLRASVTLN